MPIGHAGRQATALVLFAEPLQGEARKMVRQPLELQRRLGLAHERVGFFHLAERG